MGQKYDVSCCSRNNELSFFKWEDADLILSLYVQPNAKKDEWVGKYGENIKVRITALPIENKANKHLLKFLAKSFSVPVSQVVLLKGENQRMKRIKIMNPHHLPANLEEFFQPPQNPNPQK